jgi:hypothetical protein
MLCARWFFGDFNVKACPNATTLVSGITGAGALGSVNHLMGVYNVVARQSLDLCDDEFIRLAKANVYQPHCRWVDPGVGVPFAPAQREVRVVDALTGSELLFPPAPSGTADFDEDAGPDMCAVDFLLLSHAG